MMWWQEILSSLDRIVELVPLFVRLNADARDPLSNNLDPAEVGQMRHGSRRARDRMRLASSSLTNSSVTVSSLSVRPSCQAM